MKRIVWLAGLVALAAVGAAAFIWSGAYNIAADEPHWKLTESVLENLRERSIETRLGEISVPDLDDESLIRAGAGNYDAMCAECHLEPGEDRSELSAGLYPAPPDLVREGVHDPAEAFWIIKHGIKMTGMPAWGVTHNDELLWDVVAFLRQLPELTPEQYQALVESAPHHDEMMQKMDMDEGQGGQPGH